MSLPIQNLCDAIAQNTAHDAFAPVFTPPQWELLAGYLQAVDLDTGQVLFEEGSEDRSVFFLESGALSVHVIGDKDRMRLAILNPGAVIGEGAFFSCLPRSANVAATGPTRVWRMTSARFTEMSNRQPNLALELALALGGVLAKRLAIRSKRVAVT